MREQRIRWLGHVERMDDKRTPVKAKNYVVDGSKKDRPKKRWKEVVEKDRLVAGLRRTDAQDRSYGGLAAETGSQEKQAVFQEDEDIYQHCWNKWKTVDCFWS